MKDRINRRGFVVVLGGGLGACAPSGFPATRTKAETMSAPRIDPYTWPHKMLRRLLFDAAQSAGTVDSDDSTAMRQLGMQLVRTLDVVDRHAEHEETFLHPLLAQRLPELERSLRSEHAASSAQVERLRQSIGAAVDAEREAERRMSMLEVYRAISRFTASYLEHLDEEERALPAYWAHFEHDELADVMRRFNVSRKPAEAMQDLERMLPSLAPNEREQLLTNVRATAPEPAFRQACTVARRVLDDAGWAKLRACVSVP